MLKANSNKSYPCYKPSGIEWIGEMPERWGLRRLRFTGTFSPKKSSMNAIKANTEVQFVPMELVPDTEDELKMEQTAIYSDVKDGYTYFQNNDVVIAKITPCFENGKGAIANNLINGIGFGTTELHVIRPNNNIILSKYLFLLTKLKAFREIGESMMKGSAGQKRVPELFIKDCFMPLPPLPEQQAIASFLDRETARINKIIEKQTRLIELLKEKRSAFITQAVTRGLDPNAKMKDSGVEWIREIPEGWEVKRLKYIARLKSGESITSDDIKTDGEYPVYGGNGLRGYYESFTHEGDYVLIGRQGALCGNINYAKGKFWASEHAVVVTPIIPIDVIWLGELLNVMNLNQYSISAAQPGLSVDRIKNLFIPFPRLKEQIDISNYIQNESIKTDSLITKIEKQIELLNEYKQSLITAAVTGKIDMRNVQ